MSEKMKKILCRAGYFERLPREKEDSLHTNGTPPEGVFWWYNSGPGPVFYAYYVNDEEIDLKDAELFLRYKHYRTMKACAVIGTVCAVVCAVCLVLFVRALGL